jgi:ketosteroid isomerase-like protein
MMHPNLEIAKQYIALFNEMPLRAEKLTPFFAPEIIWQEMPNLFSPAGKTRELPQMLEGLEQGNKLLKEQRYLVRQAMAHGDSVALEIDWEAATAQPLAHLPAGAQLRAKVAIFLVFREGKIISQRDYTCYYPLATWSVHGSKKA